MSKCILLFSLMFSLNLFSQSIETSIFVPSFNNSIYVFTNSIQNTNTAGVNMAVLSRPAVLTNANLHLELNSNSKIEYFISNNNLKSLSNLTYSSISNSSVSATGFTDITFFSTGAVAKIHDENYYTTQGAFINTSRGNFICIQRGIEFFSSGEFKGCERFKFPANISLNNSSVIQANHLSFSDINVISRVRMISGQLQTPNCSSGAGSTYDYAGSYKLDSNERILEASTQDEYLVQYGQIQRKTFQFKSEDCVLKGYLSTSINKNVRQNGSRLINSDLSASNYVQYNHICQIAGYQQWATGMNYVETYLSASELFYDIAIQDYVYKNAGDKVNVFNEGGCAAYGNLI